MFSWILIQNRKNTRLCEQNKNLQYLRMFKRMLLLALIWILKWSKFSCNSFDLNRSPGVHSGRLVHGRWSDNTLQCDHRWAFSGVGVSATELWRLWQTPSGLADWSIRPFQGTGILVCTCESWVKFILSTWKNNHKYYHLQMASNWSKFLTTWFDFIIFLMHCINKIIVYFIPLDMYSSSLQIFDVSIEHLLSLHRNL